MKYITVSEREIKQADMVRTRASMLNLSFLAALMVVLVSSQTPVLAVRSDGPALTEPQVQSVEAPWAVYVFLNADNNLDMAGLDDVREMERGVKDGAGIPVVVQIDRANSGARRLLVREGRTEVVSDLGEVDMGSPDTLTDFVFWAHANYPGARTMLVIWNHGAGWLEGERRFGEGPRGISYDDTSGNHITTFQLGPAMDKISGCLGRRLDILGFDACLMNMAEVVWQLGDGVRYCIGSEEVEPGDGWPYNSILSALCSEPGTLPENLARTIVSKYNSSYWLPIYNVTQSAIDVSSLKSFRGDFNFWLEAVLGTMEMDKQLFSTAWHGTQRYYYSAYADFFHFVRNVKKGILPVIGNKILLEATKRVLAWEDRIILKSGSSGGAVKKSRGLSIHLANLSGSSYYRHLAFAKETLWDEFITRFRPLPPSENTGGSGRYAPGGEAREFVAELCRRRAASSAHALFRRIRALPPLMFLAASPLLEYEETFDSARGSSTR